MGSFFGVQKNYFYYTKALYSKSNCCECYSLYKMLFQKLCCQENGSA